MKKLICLLFLGFAAFASNAQEIELTDTLYYKNGVIMACKVNKIDAWEIGFEKQHDTSLAFQTVSQNLIDSIYVFNPLRFSSNSTPAKVGTNLIVSGVTTFVSAISIFVGVQLEQLEEAAFVAGISSVISTASLINAGVVSNAQEPPPTHLKHIIVF